MCGSLDRKTISDLNAPSFLATFILCKQEKHVCSFQCIDEEKDFILTRLA